MVSSGLSLFRLERNHKTNDRTTVGANSYDWGKIGNESAAARFTAAHNPDFKLEAEKPYAEVISKT